MQNLEVINKLKKTINNRIVGIMSHGKSIEQLETEIVGLKDYNICWCSFNYWTLMEDFILSKINRQLDIVLDCAISPSWKELKTFEEQTRIPDLIKLIDRETLIISSRDLLVRVYLHYGLDYFYGKCRDKISFIEDTNLHKVTTNPDNSLGRLIALTIMGEPKKIILFGVDGYKEQGKGIHTYYKSDLWEKRKKALKELDYQKNYLKNMLKYDTETFETKCYQYCMDCAKYFNVKMPEIINCSPNSLFTNFRKIDYSDLTKELE